MEELRKIWAGIDLILQSAALWRCILIVVVVMAVRGAYRIQRSQANNVDFFDLIRDHSLPGKPLSKVSTFYMMLAVAVTVVYVFACTRPTATIADINLLTLTVGGLGIATQGWNKFVETPKPAATIINQAAPLNPGVTINNTGTGP